MRTLTPKRGLLLGLALGAVGTVAIGLVLALAIGLLGSSSDSPRRVVIDDEHVAVELRVPADIGISGVYANPAERADSACRVLVYNFGRQLTIEAVAADCVDEDDGRIINGRHGHYRTIDDVPAPLDVVEVDTGVGTAQVFLQEYAEYTNTSNEWEEPVAIVVLDDPADPEFPTLVLRSDKAELDREAFTEIVQSLRSLD
ncbi:hypothetical protein AB0B28_01770 [Glycomyces sp. NPDC046736]|uniref:hypothetical protein n=1 Tax=Glycomyces sp. NPDC046736 TaxID=3155615 RepID=UPI00340570F2